MPAYLHQTRIMDASGNPSRGLFAFLKSSFHLPKAKAFEAFFGRFSPTDWLITLVLATVIVSSAFAMLVAINTSFMVEVPIRGGSLTEGVVGTARFVNPLLAISDADRDLTTLVYSGLLRPTPQGDLVPDLAHSYTVSEDGLTYTVFIREDARFHDDSPVTSDDVVFSVHAAQNPALKSPKRANWEGVSVEAADARTVRFTLKQPYAPFIENLTMGILPAKIWEGVSADEFPFSDFNTHPVGTGPYKVQKVTRNSSGIPDTYELTPFENSTRGPAYLSRITIRLYASEEEARNAYTRGEINSVHSVNPGELKLSASDPVYEAVLSRVFGIFFNQNKADILTDAVVRKALDTGIDKERIVANVLGGYGIAAASPLPPATIPEPTQASEETPTQRARAILEANGWVWKANEDGTGIWTKKSGKTTREISMTITTASVPELKDVATLVKEDWEKLGVPTTLQFFDANDLQQNVIRPREYSALLFGEVVGRELDLFAFWHASQRNDPGLNVALYANIEVDKLLEKARAARDAEEQRVQTEKAAEAIAQDYPAAFLYVPSFVYVLPKEIRGVTLRSISVPSERFANVNEWYVSTEKVWGAFTQGREVIE